MLGCDGGDPKRCFPSYQIKNFSIQNTAAAWQLYRSNYIKLCSSSYLIHLLLAEATPTVNHCKHDTVVLHLLTFTSHSPKRGAYPPYSTATHSYHLVLFPLNCRSCQRCVCSAGNGQPRRTTLCFRACSRSCSGSYGNYTVPFSLAVNYWPVLRLIHW